MKKSSHTMERNIGIYVLGLLVFLAISCSQDVLAVTAVNGVTLNVQAANTTANKLLYNKIAYKLGSTAQPAVPLLWTEKAVYNGTATADAEIKVTATTKVAGGDLIVKVDMLTATSGSALIPHNMTVASYWLKSKAAAGPFSSTAITLTPNGTDGVVKGTLSTLALETNVALSTTFTLFDFFTAYNMPMHVIFTAVLVDDVESLTPQVLGVDVQSIFFNYIDMSVADWDTLQRPIWLDLIQGAPVPAS